MTVSIGLFQLPQTTVLDKPYRLCAKVTNSVAGGIWHSTVLEGAWTRYAGSDQGNRPGNRWSSHQVHADGAAATTVL